MNTLLSMNSGTTATVTQSNFTNGTVIASGDPTATINLGNNYWGTTNATQIAAKITDNSDNSSLPTVNTTPVLSAASPAGTATANTRRECRRHLQRRRSVGQPQHRDYQHGRRGQPGHRHVQRRQRSNGDRHARDRQRRQRQREDQLLAAGRHHDRHVHNRRGLLRHGDLPRQRRRHAHADLEPSSLDHRRGKHHGDF